MEAGRDEPILFWNLTSLIVDIERNKFIATVGGTTVAEYTEFNQNVPTWTKSYTYFGSSQLATITPNGLGGEYVEFSHPDRLGTKMQTNQAGGTAYEQNTLPFGRPLNAESTVTNNNKRFTSYDRSSATGLDYAINRTYDSKQGRFTQVDPIDIEASDLLEPQTLNLFLYCGNDPINHFDPDGLFFGKVSKAIGNFFKKVFTNKWFLIAVSAALAVVTIGAGLGLWSLTAVGFQQVSIMGYTGIAMTLSVPVTTTTLLGWVATGLKAIAAVSALNQGKGILKSLIDFGIGYGLGYLPSPISTSGSPSWNPNVSDFQVRPGGRRGSYRGRRYGLGSWSYGWKPARIPTYRQN